MASFSEKKHTVAIHKRKDCKERNAYSLPSFQDNRKIWRPKRKGNTTGTSISKSQDDLESRASASLRCLSDHQSKNAQIAKLKPKMCSTSMGTVSGFLGREYIKLRPQPNELCEKSQPAKLNSDDFPVSQIWNENVKLDSSSAPGSEIMNCDIEDFLLKMLGDGCQLEMSVIQDVVGQCRYDIQMCVEKLLDLSATTLEKSDDVTLIAAQNPLKNSLDLESASCELQSQFVDISKSRGELLLPRREKQKNGIHQEVLETLFSVPDIIEENKESNCQIRQECRRSPHGRVVTKPLEETIIEDFTFITRQPVYNRKDAANGNSYEDLRKAVMEYWFAMKEYYKAAVDAFAMKDHKIAHKLLEEGHFFMKKAREADEKSAQQLIENSYEEEFSLNVHYLEPKDAVHHLRLHLTSFSGFPSIHYTKVVIGTTGRDNREGRRKRLITKLLEREGIPWTEEGNGQIISIRVDEIDPKKLSFYNI